MSLTTPEVATVLGITPSAVRDLVHRDQLAPLRPGARPLRFAEDTVNALRARRWATQSRASRSQVDDTWAEVDRLLAVQVSRVRRSRHAEHPQNRVEA